MSLLVFMLVAASLWAAGRGALLLAVPRVVVPLPRELRWCLGWVAGLLLLTALLEGLHFLGLRWTLLSVGVPLLLLGALGLRVRPPMPWGRSEPLGWGDALAAAAVAVLAVACLCWLATNPDFIYHWGIKGHRYFLVGGFDLDYLIRPWNRLSHPEYPPLLPGLFAATALAVGAFDEAVLLLWTPLTVLALLAAARGLLAQAGVEAFHRQAGVAILGLVGAFFSVGALLAGGPDPFLALALMLGGVALVRGGSLSQAQRDLCLALAAALAAVAKLEGLPLAVFLVAVYGVELKAWRGREAWKRLLTVGSPAALVSLPWLWICWRHGLFGRPNAGAFEWGHAKAIFGAVGKAVVHSHWHGVAVFALAATPLLLWNRRLRAWVSIPCLQLGLYLWVYFTSANAPERQVQLSLPRILFHLVPALLVAVVLAADRWAEGDEAPAAPESVSSVQRPRPM
jgi:hypothetical protein